MTIADAPIKTSVAEAIEGLRDQYGDNNVTFSPDGQGGAWVEIEEVPLSENYLQHSSFIAFLLPFNLPNADVYPVFVRSDLKRADGRPLGEGFQQTEAAVAGENPPRRVVQVSRRTRNGQFSTQTPALKIEKVLAWIRDL